MPNPTYNKRKGSKAEVDGANYLSKNGVPNAERRHLSGNKDKGDISGFCHPDGSKKVCVEIKSGSSMNLPQWLRELDAEIENSGSDTGYVWIRPNGKPDPADWFVVMPTKLHMELLREAGYIYE